MSCEGEGERDFLFKWLWGPDDQIRKIETPCPEYPGLWPEYQGVTFLTCTSWICYWTIDVVHYGTTALNL